MKIAIDFDDCFTVIEESMSVFIRSLLATGNEVKFVTFRSEDCNNCDIKEVASSLSIDIIYTAGKQKANCYDADVWIDDMPVCIPKCESMEGMIRGCKNMGDT